MQQFSKEDTEELISKALKRVEQLPFSDYLAKDRVVDYFRNILQQDENPLWHVERLTGFGSSEIGFLVADIRNRNRKKGDDYYAGFKSARNVVAEKLMYQIPEPNEVMYRGKRIESFIATIFIEQMREAGHKIERADDVLEKLKQSDSSHSEYPWLKGKNIDDAFYIDGKLILVDYKAPSEAAFSQLVEDEGGLTYQAQLNQYALFAKDKGIEFDGLCLAPFNYYNATVSPVFLDPDPELQKEIINAGNHFWHENVLQGLLPNIPTAHDEVYDPDALPTELYQQAAQHASLRALHDITKELVDESKKTLEKAFEHNGINKDTVYELGAFTGSTRYKTELNENAIIETADRVGLDKEKYTNKGKLSIKRLHTALVKMADENPNIRVENLAAVIKTGNLRVVSSNKPLSGLWEAVKSESKGLVTEAVNHLASKQMEVLPQIRDMAEDEKKKLTIFQNSQKQMESNSGALNLSVIDILAGGEAKEATAQKTSNASAAGRMKQEQSHTQAKQSSPEPKDEKSQAKQESGLGEMSDFEVDFGDSSSSTQEEPAQQTPDSDNMSDFEVDFGDMDDEPAPSNARGM